MFAAYGQFCNFSWFFLPFLIFSFLFFFLLGILGGDVHLTENFRGDTYPLPASACACLYWFQIFSCQWIAMWKSTVVFTLQNKSLKNNNHANFLMPILDLKKKEDEKSQYFFLYYKKKLLKITIPHCHKCTHIQAKHLILKLFCFEFSAFLLDNFGKAQINFTFMRISQVNITITNVISSSPRLHNTLFPFLSLLRHCKIHSCQGKHLGILKYHHHHLIILQKIPQHWVFLYLQWLTQIARLSTRLDWTWLTSVPLMLTVKLQHSAKFKTKNHLLRTIGILFDIFWISMENASKWAQMSLV